VAPLPELLAWRLAWCGSGSLGEFSPTAHALVGMQGWAMQLMGNNQPPHLPGLLLVDLGLHLVEPNTHSGGAHRLL